MFSLAALKENMEKFCFLYFLHHCCFCVETLAFSNVHVSHFYAPALIGWGQTAFALSVCPFPCLFAKNMDQYFEMDTVLIFHMFIPCGKTFLLHQGQGHLSRSNIIVTVFTKLLNIDHNF